MKTVKQVRESFWNDHPKFKKEYVKVKVKAMDKNSLYGSSSKEYYRPKKQNEYKCDIRMAFCDYVEHLRSNGIITEKLAYSITL